MFGDRHKIATQKSQIGAELVVRALESQGVTHVFGEGAAEFFGVWSFVGLHDDNGVWILSANRLHDIGNLRVDVGELIGVFNSFIDAIFRDARPRPLDAPQAAATPEAPGLRNAKRLPPASPGKPGPRSPDVRIPRPKRPSTGLPHRWKGPCHNAWL